MLPLAHIGITLFVAYLLYLPLTYAFVGVLLPDLIDKSAFVLGIFPCGRYIAHSPFLGIVMTIVVYLITKKREYALAFLFGYIFHLVQDAQYIVLWAFPFVSYELVCPPELMIKPTIIDVFLDSVGAILLAATFTLKPRLKVLKDRIKRIKEGIKNK